MERLLEHDFFEKLENEQKFDILGFQNLLEIIKKHTSSTKSGSIQKLSSFVNRVPTSYLFIAIIPF